MISLSCSAADDVRSNNCPILFEVLTLNVAMFTGDSLFGNFFWGGG